MSIKSSSKVLKVLKTLRGHSLSGISNQTISEQLDMSPSTVTRALQTLIDEGFAQKLENGLFVLSTSLVQIANAHQDEMKRADDRIQEIKQRTAIY